MKCLMVKTVRAILAVSATFLVFSASGCGDGADPAGDATIDSMTDLQDPDVAPDEGSPDVVGDTGPDTSGDQGQQDQIGETVSDVPACDPGADCSAGPDNVVLQAGSNKLEFDRVARTITLKYGDQPRLILDFDAIQVGAVPALDPTMTYDPYPMLARDEGFYPQSGLKWLPLTHFVHKITDGCTSSFDVTMSDGINSVMGKMVVTAPEDGSFGVNLIPMDGDMEVAYFRIAPDVTETENFYGLGAYLDQVAHRGKVRAMQLETDFNIESSYNEAHVPVPLLISTNAWGIFVESWYPGAFDCAAWESTKVDIVFGTGEGSSDGFQFHLYAAEKPLDITKHYYTDTGDALLPARWGLGPVVWKDEVTGQDEVEWDLDTIRALKLPTTAYWIDRPYASGVNAFDFHPDNYDDPQAMIDKAHDMGFRMMLWSTPYISSGKNGDKESSPTTEALYKHAKDNDFLVDGVLILNKWGEPIDFTNPDAYAWFQGLIRQYTDMGIEGFKLDYGEDIVIGMLGMDVLDTQFFDGSTERTMHAKYQIFYHKIYAETLPSDGGFLMARRGVWGDQKNVSVIWPGDLDANFAKHREPMADNDGKIVNMVGGLPASVIYGLTLGVSGFPFFGSDTGGYRHSPPGKELFARWAEQTALSSIMQVGNSSNTVPWDLESGYDLDQEFQDIYRKWATFHLRLWPYHWTYAKNIAVTGHPIQRPFGMAYPELGVHPDDQYMFGDDLLVAPVVTQGAVERDVILPPGKWWDLDQDIAREGGQTITVSAPLDVLPLFMRQGAIVPLLRRTIEAIAPVGEGQEIDTYHGNPGILYPMVFAGDPSTFTLFDGTVLGQGWVDDDVYELTFSDGLEFTQGAIFDVVGLGDDVPVMMMDGIELAYYAMPDELEEAEYGFCQLFGHTLVKVPGGERKVTITFLAAD